MRDGKSRGNKHVFYDVFELSKFVGDLRVFLFADFVEI
jgi:hypothetical protein